MIFVGIDPGITGACAVIEDELAEVFDLPVMANGKGKSKVKNQINAAQLAREIEGLNGALVYLERVSSMPGQGVASMFSMGDTFGAIRGVCAALGHSVEIVTPQKWKKHYLVGSDKEVIRAKAIEIFPELSADLARKKDHNRAEALLIAKYAKDMHK